MLCIFIFPCVYLSIYIKIFSQSLTYTHITHTHTHTYLTLTSNTPIKPDRKGSMTRSEKDRNGTYPSEPNRSPSIDS